MQLKLLIIRDLLLVSTFVLLISFFVEINKKDNTKIYHSKDILISIPKDTLTSHDLIIIWGGMYYADKDWMYQQIPQKILDRDIIVFANYKTEIKSIEIAYKKIVKSKIKNKSLIGFSAGCLKVYDNYSNEYKFVGLIDPTTYQKHTNIKFNSNVVLVYNDKNWSKKIATNQRLISSKIKKCSIVERTNKEHSVIPKYFFKKYLK